MIDTQAVRNKILNLAMRGQLAEQNPNDGTSEELYCEIIKEKARLVKEGIIKKEKPLGDISADDTPFDIPTNWKWVYFGEIFSHNTGKALNASDNEGNLLEYITTSNMYWDHFELDNLKKMYFKDEEIEKCTIRKGDLLICEGGDIGRSAIWNFPYEMRIQNHIHKLRPYLSSLSPVFYYYVMMLYKALNMINGQGIGLQGFSSKRVHTLVVPLPPASEQTRIVERIESIFDVLDKIDALQNQYAFNQEALKSKLIDAAIQGNLTEQLPEDGTAEELYKLIGEKKKNLIKDGKLKKAKALPAIKLEDLPFEIPSNWGWYRLGDIGITVTGSTPPKSHSEYYGGNYPFFKPADLDRGKHITSASEYLTDAGKNVSRQLEKGTVLVCCIGSIGKCAIIDEEGTANQQINALTPINCSSEYLLYVISSQYFKKQLNEGSRATTVSIINKAKFDNCIIPLPPQVEQERIVCRLNEILNNISE